MTTQTLTLSAFLLARIEEDERVAARATSGGWRAHWSSPHAPFEKSWPDDVPPPEGWSTVGVGEHFAEVAGCHGGGPDQSLRPPDALHIARHDPARVLAECKAKRVALDYYYLNDDDVVLSATIKALAAVYADHPDYDPDWA